MLVKWGGFWMKRKSIQIVGKNKGGWMPGVISRFLPSFRSLNRSFSTSSEFLGAISHGQEFPP